ncbi:unnamed protein product [Coffea canephora]|uniref:DH200=94 genomic scaffold, scaffold_150 n=1 Tax=Coffea canephora TaxID=49390 RepID=A0A068V949_COFCA|nr:unnamed protein product [Coffea canephora]
MDLIVSLSQTLEDLFSKEPTDIIRHKLILLRNLIGFVTMRGVECKQLTDPLSQVATVAARLFSVCQLDRYDKQVVNRMKSEISQLIHEKINPLDTQVRETYIDVLRASKKQSRSSFALALEENECPVVVQFVESLHHYLMDLPGYHASFQVPVKDHILKLHQGIRYLSTLLKQEEKLDDEMKDLLGLAVCDAGILIFSLSVNEIKEGLPRETYLRLFHLHKVLKYMMADLAHNYLVTSPYSSCNYRRSNELGYMDFFLEDLQELARCDEADDSNVVRLDRIQLVHKDLVFLRSVLENIKEQRFQNGKLQVFWSYVMEVAYKAELLIDSTLVGDKCEDSLDAIARDINLLKIEALEIHNGQTQRVNKNSILIPSQLAVAVHNEDLVGLDDKVKTIIDRLTRGLKQLDVVPIVGMPGLGKTTLANKVYTASSVRSYFHVRGWCCVSQTYSKHSLFVQLLCSIHSKSPNEYLKMDENDLVQKLKQVLLRTRYLLILDDLWDVEAWNLLENSLPNDVNGSRILFTSRFQDLSLQFKPGSKSYHLCQLTDEESWVLLQKKLFDKEGCPPKLSEVGYQIAKFCRGLPLTVVLVAGILATIAQDSWEEVAKSLKDEVIDVRRLLWLWISEGFVQQTEGKSLEEAAYNYLMGLINRSLVVANKKGAMNGAKTCQLHDLVHEFCMKKAEEECFLHIIHSWKDPFGLTGPSNPHRVCVHDTRKLKIWELMLLFPNLRCLLLPENDILLPQEEDWGILLPKLLRVLDLGGLIIGKSFPMEVVLLVHLRYLVLSGIRSIPSAIDNLSRLKTLIVQGVDFVVKLPDTIWNIKTLSYLRTMLPHGFSFPDGNLEVSPDLDHLETLSLAIDPSAQCLQRILKKLPSIRWLKCWRSSGLQACARNRDKILVFNCLKLESLHLENFRNYRFEFPLNLKKLVLEGNRQPWSEISTIGKLPHLEVLKLLDDSFIGEEWEMKEGEFPSLRVLKLSDLDIRRWTASSGNFSHLEKLVVDNCDELEEVPSCLGECPTLETIEVTDCPESVVNSVNQIRQEQLDMGNAILKIVIENPSEEESNSQEAEEISSETESFDSGESE